MQRCCIIIGPNASISSYTKITVLCLLSRTFCLSRRRREMYCGLAHLCVCVSVCLCVCVPVCLSVRGRMPTLLHGPGCSFGSGRVCPLVVHYWADLQSVHGLRCYGNITRTRNVSEYMLVLALCQVTFRVSRRRREMYCGHARLCVCLSVCLSVSV